MPSETSTSIPEFGDFRPDIPYVLRPGGYAVIARGDGLIAVVEWRGGYFLPGGGQEAGESPEQAAVREALEECGLRIRVIGRIGVADQSAFGTTEQKHFRKRCTFVTAEFVSQDGDGETDHHLVWKPPQEAVMILSHKSQRWAVAEAIRIVGR